MRRTLASVLTVGLVLAVGCSVLGPRPARYDYFVLTPLDRTPAPDRVPVAGREAATLASIPILVVDPVTIPDYLDRDSLATRVAPQQLTYSKRDRWAEPLDDGLTRTLRQNLGLLLGSRVLVQPRRLAAPPDFSVAVDVLRFERLGARQVELWARFTIRADGALLHAGETHLVEPTAGATAADGSAALSRALGRMSRDIAAAVLAVGSTAVAPSGGSAAEPGSSDPPAPGVATDAGYSATHTGAETSHLPSVRMARANR